MDLDKFLEMSFKGQLIEEKEIIKICQTAQNILAEESNVPVFNAPVTVCGDIHGQFYDLLELISLSRKCPSTKYIFLGDYVDRGKHSLECIQLLICLKVKYPESILLIRGNHESRRISLSYGFYEECNRKYGNTNVWESYNNFFDYLPIAALIDGKIFCVHGGHSPKISHIDQIRTITRFREIPVDDEFSDLLWSDPTDLVDYWGVNQRGTGYMFGEKVNKEFNHINNIELTCRSHQLTMDGFKYMFSDFGLLTVWSAPNYCYRCGNAASVVKFDEHLNREIRLFFESEKSNKPESIEKESLPYFM